MIFATPYHQHLQTTQDAAIDWSKTPPAKHDHHVFCYHMYLMKTKDILDTSKMPISSLHWYYMRREF